MTYGQVPHFFNPISRIVLGAMPLGGKDLGAAFGLLDAYRDLGGNTIDNSVVYGPGIAATMKAYYEKHGEDALIRMDKGNHHAFEGDAGRRVTREAMDEDIRKNLEAQGVSYSDFYLLHRDDERVPVGDVMQWLNEHKAAGRIRAFGVSNWKTSRIEAANEYAEKHGLQGLSMSSSNLSLAKVNEPMWWEAHSLTREERRWHAQHSLPLFAWSSGGGGFFAGADSPDVRRVYDNPENHQRKARLESMAVEKGVTPTQLALAWTLNQAAGVWAIVGPRSPEELQDNVGAINIQLTPYETRWLEFGE